MTRAAVDHEDKSDTSHMRRPQRESHTSLSHPDTESLIILLPGGHHRVP